MKQYQGFSRTDVIRGAERLPAGGYVLKIMDVKYQENDWGDMIVLFFDIAEGEQKNYYSINYRSQNGEDKKWKGTYRLRVPKDDGTEQDGWAKKRFNTVIVAFEESNPGYHWDWDEQTMKGKLIGGLFNNKEYEFEGRHGFFTNCHSLVTAEKIRSGKFEIPADTLLKNKAESEYPAGSRPIGDGFMNIPDGVEDEGLPF